MTDSTTDEESIDEIKVATTQRIQNLLDDPSLQGELAEVLWREEVRPLVRLLRTVLIPSHRGHGGAVDRCRYPICEAIVATLKEYR